MGDDKICAFYAVINNHLELLQWILENSSSWHECRCYSKHTYGAEAVYDWIHIHYCKGNPIYYSKIYDISSDISIMLHNKKLRDEQKKLAKDQQKKLAEDHERDIKLKFDELLLYQRDLSIIDIDNLWSVKMDYMWRKEELNFELKIHLLDITNDNKVKIPKKYTLKSAPKPIFNERNKKIYGCTKGKNIYHKSHR